MKKRRHPNQLIPRTLTRSLQAASAQYPVVTLLGPRQSGKTTLVRACFTSHEYCNLEEPGLAAYLLEIRSPAQVSRDPLLGALFENLVVTEALKSCWHRGEDADLYFVRDHKGVEIDLIHSRQRKLHPIEIKAARSYHSDFTKPIRTFRALDKRVQPGALVYAGAQSQQVNEFSLLTLRELDAFLHPA